MFNRESVAEDFAKSRVLIVEFTKKNGDRRVMECTTDLSRIPSQYHPKPLADGVEPNEPSDTVCNVYVLGVGWRSFRYDSVIKIS